MNFQSCSRTLVALVLILAAAAKAYQLAVEPFFVSELFGARWPEILVALLELLLGLWLLTDFLPTWSLLTAICCFVTFGVVSFYKAISGAESCGCFGELKINPWITLGLDCAIAALLTYTIWQLQNRGSNNPIGVNNSLGTGTAFAIWAIVSIPVGACVGFFPIPTASLLNGHQLHVVDSDLCSKEWLDQQFPLVKDINNGHQLKKGTWLVLLHKQNCSSCRKAVQDFSQLAGDFSTIADGPRVAIIEVPPYSAKTVEVRSEVFLGRLSNTKGWKVDAPLAMIVDGGNVSFVFDKTLQVELIRKVWGR